MVSMLKVNNLTKSYIVGNKRIPANKNIHFEVPNGSVVWIYGNSGSGKSTLLNMLVGLDSADKGTVYWDDKDLLSLKNGERADFRLKNCGLIFQFFELIKTQTVFSNVSIPLRLQKKSKKVINEEVQEILSLFGISDMALKKTDKLSGGEKQRVAIARALVSKPLYIIADEITASLDLDMSHKVYSYIRNYIKENNGIGIFVSHDPIIKDYADSIFKMSDGILEKEA